MKEHLTLVYVTSRKEPQLEWFIDSLANQMRDEDEIHLVAVDRLKSDRKIIYGTQFFAGKGSLKIIHTEPKPNVWQGEHRLTKQDWFAVANARNTGLCLAPDGWIAYVDDLSVLMPGWLTSLQSAMEGGYVVCGAYRKVSNLKVENGNVISFTDYPAGRDQRWQYATGDPCLAERGWLFGCSCAMRVEALLSINGWMEACDGTGFEDCCTGIALQNAGYTMKYDRRMLTLESEEHHHIEPSLRREDWHFENGVAVTGGNNGDDKSHRLLNIAESSKFFPNTFNIREMRNAVLAGEPFPINQIPDREWFSGVLLSEL